MQINQTPLYNAYDTSTGCCARFKPAGWDAQMLHFDKKRFVRVTTRPLVPL